MSYDLPFALRNTLKTDPVVLVTIDETSARALQQPLDRPWDRRIFIQLLEVLKQERARLTCLDLIFSDPSPQEGVDEEFAKAMKEQGNVILGGDYLSRRQFDVEVATVAKPTPVLRESMAGWGLLVLRPIDPDGAVRELGLQKEGFPTLAATAAKTYLGNSSFAPPAEAQRKFWLNYYGPASEAFAEVPLADALRKDGVPPEFFRDRVVFVGGRYSTGSLTAAKDVFATPYSRWGRGFSAGAEVHATAFLNLIRHEWLERTSSANEVLIISVLGLLVGGGLCFLRPHWALLIALAFVAGCLSVACWLTWHRQLWFPWAIPAFVQLPAALAWSVGAQYFLEQRRRSALRHAFAYYLSPGMADRIANSDFDLRPGGSAVEVTVLFTDLENFTALSEKLAVEEVSKILIGHFTETTHHILANKGTIIKYIGDSVMATWNAPLADPKHAEHALRAALALAEASNREIQGYKLRTRVGINTGQALAGNLGSPFRFDYTLIGDTINFASRLESMNKYLGTQILISESTCAALPDSFLVRRLGKFVLKGKTLPVELFELLGLKSDEANLAETDWYRAFQEGVETFARGDLEQASKHMTKSLALRNGEDGPSEFYLRYISDYKDGVSSDGLLRMDEK